MYKFIETFSLTVMFGTIYAVLATVHCLNYFK